MLRFPHLPASVSTFDPRERALEKARLRDADERALASGAKSPAQLRQENGHFGRLRVRMDLDRARALS